MTYSKKIAKFWTRFGIILMIALGVITLVFRWHRIFPTDEVSELYTRYEHVEGLDVSYIKDFKVNDTVCVDVTMLEAKTDSAWVLLKRDFEVAELTQEYQDMIDNGMDMVFIRLITKSAQEAAGHSYTYNALAISHLLHTLTVFHTMSEAELDAVNQYTFDKNIT
ncbi:MAG: hypothetical protein MJZ77_04055 [Bacteroidales bacterium]|nr:hypothetical protein [Bacteroidales bacterium]